MSLLAKDEIVAALRRLGEEAAAQNKKIELIILGGALMVLGYDARPSTHDVDALFVNPQDANWIRRTAKQIAAELELDEDWLNDAAKGYAFGHSKERILFAESGITAYAPDPAQALALKLGAWRDDVDIADARVILENISGVTSAEQVWDRIEPFIVPNLRQKTHYALQDLWESKRGNT